MDDLLAVAHELEFGDRSKGISIEAVNVAIAACRELANLRETPCGDFWIDGEFDPHKRDATDAALAAWKAVGR